jgi:hypothetical protein
MTPTLTLGLLLVAGVATGIASWWMTRRDFLTRFSQRSTVSPEEALSEFGHSTADLRELWLRLESRLGVPKGKLRLTDRFDTELRPNPKIAIYQTGQDAIEDLQECFPNEKLRIETVNDYCRYALVLKERRNPVNLAKDILG